MDIFINFNILSIRINSFLNFQNIIKFKNYYLSKEIQIITCRSNFHKIEEDIFSTEMLFSDHCNVF